MWGGVQRGKERAEQMGSRGILLCRAGCTGRRGSCLKFRIQEGPRDDESFLCFSFRDVQGGGIVTGDREEKGVGNQGEPRCPAAGALPAAAVKLLPKP